MTLICLLFGTCKYIIFFLRHFPTDLPISVWMLLTLRHSYGCCLDIDKLELVVVRLLFYCYIWKFIRWGRMFLLAHFLVAPEPRSHFLKCRKSLLFICRVFYWRLSWRTWRTAPHFPISHWKIFLVGDSKVACHREREHVWVLFLACLPYPSIWWVFKH